VKSPGTKEDFPLEAYACAEEKEKRPMNPNMTLNKAAKRARYFFPIFALGLILGFCDTTRTFADVESELGLLPKGATQVDTYRELNLGVPNEGLVPKNKNMGRSGAAPQRHAPRAAAPRSPGPSGFFPRTWSNNPYPPFVIGPDPNDARINQIEDEAKGHIQGLTGPDEGSATSGPTSAGPSTPIIVPSDPVVVKPGAGQLLGPTEPSMTNIAAPPPDQGQQQPPDPPKEEPYQPPVMSSVPPPPPPGPTQVNAPPFMPGGHTGIDEFDPHLAWQRPPLVTPALSPAVTQSLVEKGLVIGATSAGGPLGGAVATGIIGAAKANPKERTDAFMQGMGKGTIGMATGPVKGAISGTVGKATGKAGAWATGKALDKSFEASGVPFSGKK